MLSDKNILEEIEKGRLKIDPFNKEHLTSNGYDLSVFVQNENDFKETDEFLIKPMQFCKLKTIESIEMPDDIIGLLYLRSKYSRNGLIGMFAVVDAGFKGRLFVSVKNLATEDIVLKPKEGVIHIIFDRLESKAKTPYGITNKSHFQNQQ
jgi:dCTP deaminase